jgi:hypothetical protein
MIVYMFLSRMLGDRLTVLSIVIAYYYLLVTSSCVSPQSFVLAIFLRLLGFVVS